MANAFRMPETKLIRKICVETRSVGEGSLTQFTSHAHLPADGEKRAWVNRLPIDLDFIMQMRAGRSAGIAHLANHRIFRNIITDTDGDPCQMRVEC